MILHDDKLTIMSEDNVMIIRRNDPHDNLLLILRENMILMILRGNDHLMILRRKTTFMIVEKITDDNNPS